MGNIFISYSHKDNNYVKKLEKALHQRKFEVWRDLRIAPGTEWPTVIQKQLDACEAFIVVLSENARTSEWVSIEVARAKRKNKPFFPLLLSGDGDGWIYVETTQYVDVRDEKLPPQEFYDRLAAVTTRGQIYDDPPPIPPPFKIKQLILLLLKAIVVLILLAVAARVLFPKNSTLLFQRLQSLTLNMQITNEKTTWVNPLRVMMINATRQITITIDPGRTRRVACWGWNVQPKAVEIVQEQGCSLTFYAITYQDTTVNVNVTVEGRSWEKTLYFRPKR